MHEKDRKISLCNTVTHPLVILRSKLAEILMARLLGMIDALLSAAKLLKAYEALHIAVLQVRELSRPAQLASKSKGYLHCVIPCVNVHSSDVSGFCLGAGGISFQCCRRRGEDKRVIVHAAVQ